MKKTTFLILFFLFSIAGHSQGYQITAHLTGFPDGTVFYLKNLDVDAVIDSTVLRNNAFTLKGSLDATPQSIWLYCNCDNNFYYSSMLIGNEQISVKGDKKDFPFELTITGSPIQDGINVLNLLTKDGYTLRNKLFSEYFTLGDSLEARKDSILRVIHDLDSVNLVVRTRFIYEHPASYATLRELFYLKKSLGPDTLRHLFAIMPSSLQKSQLGIRITNYLAVGDPVKKGDLMEDFEAFDKEGRSHRPSAYKGQYVLLDFSTTYCGPCIQSLADLRKLSSAYPGKLTIITLSGDVGKKTWLDGLNRDHPDWLWDGKGIYGRAMLKYGVTGFPTFCLVDPEGKIVALWAGYGKDKNGVGNVEAKLRSIIPL